MTIPHTHFFLTRATYCAICGASRNADEDAMRAEAMDRARSVVQAVGNALIDEIMTSKGLPKSMTPTLSFGAPQTTDDECACDVCKGHHRRPRRPRTKGTKR